MLVLSRQENQRIRFPGLGISVEILDIRGSKVRVGIDAPIEVRVLRDELEDLGQEKSSRSGGPQSPRVFRLPSEVRHELRNTLHELSLLIHVYRKRAEKTGGAYVQDEVSQQQMFETIVERLNGLNNHRALSKDGVLAGQPDESNGVAGKAMIVDDNENERELLAGFMRMCGYEVTVAGDGIEAIESLCRDDLPQVVLLDIQMPRCDGREFLRRLRSTDKWDPIHVFVISGHSSEDLDLVNHDGYTHWFDKPLDPRLLVKQLNGIEAARSA